MCILIVFGVVYVLRVFMLLDRTGARGEGGVCVVVLLCCVIWRVCDVMRCDALGFIVVCCCYLVVVF